MVNIIKRINLMKNDKSSFIQYIDVFIKNDKANVLFVNSNNYKDLKKYVNEKNK